MMNLLRRLADVFRINFYCYGCPDGQSTHGHVSRLRSDAGRHPMLITPCKRSAARGTTEDSALPQPRSGLNSFAVRMGEELGLYPGLRLRLARGYPN
ncbi:MAG: hypothetical protein LBL24_10135, partial [Bacteroidales bacterium]|nr:hypothetical protein [Bacteroidales bacterium]